MLRVLSQQEWIAEVLKIRQLQLNEQPFVIEAIESLTSAKPVFYLFQERGQTLISYIAFVKNHSIGNPIYFFYSPLWIADGLSDAKYAECLNAFIKELTKSYRYIVMKLPPEISDIRPFIWSNFGINHHYTYLKDLSDLHYHDTTRKNINKCKQLGYYCNVSDLNEDSLGLNLAIYKDFNFFGGHQINIIKEFLMLASNAGYLKSFNCYRDNELVASNLILIDANQKIGYTILLNKLNNNTKDDVHSLLHDFFFNELNALGYHTIDLLGADIQNIAAFKSRFGSTLKPHFVVKYNRTSALWSDLIVKIKGKLKSVAYRN